MPEVLPNNLAIIEQRWPTIFQKLMTANLTSLQVQVEQNTLLINNIQLTSNFDRVAEAKIQTQRIPQDSAKAFVYGTGLGDVQALLLQRKSLKSLVVCLLNIDLFLHELNAIDQTDWLKDPRVTLTFAEQLKEVFEPFIALPAELMFADEGSAQLRDRLMLELDQTFIAKSHAHDNQEVIEQININIELIEKDNDVAELFNTHKGRVYVIGAGPTLNDHLERLIDNQSADEPIFVIGVDAAVRTLVNHHIIPNIVVTIDAVNEGMFAGITEAQFKNTDLVYFPRGQKQFIHKWSGARYCAYSTGALYHTIDKQYPRGKLITFGSVIHSAIDLAVKMGFGEVILLGTDFGFPEGKVYAKGQDHPYMESFLNSQHWVLNGYGEKITTMLNYRGYLRDLERYIATKPEVVFLNGSKKGASIEGTSYL